jgi:hypothetical protein
MSGFATAMQAVIYQGCGVIGGHMALIGMGLLRTSPAEALFVREAGAGIAADPSARTGPSF